MSHSVGDITGTGLALRANHGSTFVDAAQSLTQVGRTTDERHGEVELVDVVRVIGRGQNLGLVNEVNTEGLQNLCLNKVADTGFGHNRNGDGIDNALDHVRVGHTRHATLCANIGGDTLQRHHGSCAGILSDLGLLRSNDVHNDAALHHLSETALHACGALPGVVLNRAQRTLLP